MNRITTLRFFSYTRTWFLFAFLILLFGISKAQNTFEKIYGTDDYDVAWDVETTADHGFVLAGESGHAWDTCTADFILLKCDANGNMQWANRYATIFCDQAYDVKQTPDHGYLLTGVVIDTISRSYMVVMKTDSIGQIEWENYYYTNEHENGITIYPLSNGDFIIGGDRYNFTTFGYDMTMTRINANGNVIWSKVYYTAGAEYGQVQMMDNGDGTYYMACVLTELNTFPINEDFFILRLDEDGNVISAKAYGNPDIDEKGWGIIKINSNRYWLIGMGGPESHTDALIMQIDSTGNVVWSKVYNDGTYAADESSVTSFYYIPEYGLFVCGFDVFYNPYSFILDLGDAFVFQVTDSGDVAWWRDFGTDEANYWENFVRMKVTDDGSLLLAGSRTTNGNEDEGQHWDMYVAKTNADGINGCQRDMNVNVEDFDVQVNDVEVNDSSITLTVVPANFAVSSTATMTTLCYPTNAESAVAHNEIELYPNPADDYVTVKSYSSVTAKEIRFYDMLGKEIFRGDLTNSSVNIENVPENFYLYRIFSLNGELLNTGKLNVSHGE